MAKRKTSTRKPAAPSRKPRGTSATVKRTAIAKPTTQQTVKPAAKKPRTTASSAKVRTAKARAPQAGSQLAATVGRCVAKVDGWRKQCAGKLHDLVHERAAAKSRRRIPSRRKGDLDSLPQRLAARAKRVGNGLRQIELANVKTFCRREWHELVTMARKLDQLANRSATRAKRRAK